MIRRNFAWMVLIALWAPACSSTRDATRSRIELDIDRLAATGKLVITSPKDVDLQDIRVSRAGTNYSVTIGKYQAHVNRAAVDAAIAEAQSRSATLTELIGMFRVLAEKAAASQGVPMGSAAPAPVPEGFKLVPKDLPSVPRWETTPFGNVFVGTNTSIPLVDHVQ